MDQVDPAITGALRSVYDPCCRDKAISVVDMGLVHRGRIERGVAQVDLLLTSGWCPFAARVLTDVQTALRALPGITDAAVRIVWDQAWSPDRLSESARTKLRFLPAPVAVPDRERYVAQHWPTARGGRS